MKDFGINPDYYDPAPNARLFQMIILNFLLFFILLKRDLSALSTFSIIGFISVMYTIALTVGQAPEYHAEHYKGDFSLFEVNIGSI